MSDRRAMLALSGELFASRGLSLLWLPVGVFASPSLHAVPGVALPVWFWRIDPPFGAWLRRQLERAEEKGVPVPPGEMTAARIIANYLKELGEWETAKTLAPAPLPEALIRDVTAAGLAPDWYGRAAWEAKNAPPAPSVEDDPPVRASAPKPTLKRQPKAKPESTPTPAMF